MFERPEHKTWWCCSNYRFDDYINETSRELNNKEFYKEIPNDPTEMNRKKVNNAIKELKSARLLNERKAKKLQFKKQKHRRFICF